MSDGIQYPPIRCHPRACYRYSANDAISGIFEKDPIDVSSYLRAKRLRCGNSLDCVRVPDTVIGRLSRGDQRRCWGLGVQYLCKPAPAVSPRDNPVGGRGIQQRRPGRRKPIPGSTQIRSHSVRIRAQSLAGDGSIQELRVPGREIPTIGRFDTDLPRSVASIVQFAEAIRTQGDVREGLHGVVRSPS
jgi:hypothetical protein